MSDKVKNSIREVKNPAGEILWKISELSNYLNCTPRAVYGWVQSGRLATVRVGKLRRVRDSVVCALVEDDSTSCIATPSSLTLDGSILLIGLEVAESRAERERALGWWLQVIDPGIDPSDYHGWSKQAGDVLVIDYAETSNDYRLRLSKVLTEVGANSITFLPPPNALDSEVAETTNPPGRPGSS